MVQAKLGVALDAIRMAALEPRAWSRVQATTEVLLGAFASQLATVDHRKGNRFTGKTSVVPELDTKLPDLMPSSEPVLWTASHPHWRRMVDYDYIDEAGIKRSEFYARTREYDAGYRLGLRLLDTPGISSAIVWLWPQRAGHVQARELKLLKAIEHPLRLSASIAQQRWHDTAEEDNVLQSIGAPAFLVNPEGQLVASNGFGEAALLDRDAVVLDDGSLAARWRPGRDAFRRIMADAARDPDPSRPRPWHAILPRAGGGAPAAFAAMPLARRHHFISGPTTLILVVIINFHCWKSPRNSAEVCR